MGWERVVDWATSVLMRAALVCLESVSATASTMSSQGCVVSDTWISYVQYYMQLSYHHHTHNLESVSATASTMSSQGCVVCDPVMY